ncbi:MAG TPA: HPr family phosphocarrier protein, partial [Methylovirgula sp.]
MNEKESHDAETDDCAPQDAVPEGFKSCEVTIVNRKGLHARATAKLVQCIEEFDAQVLVSRCGETVGGTSIMGILTLGAGPGSTVRFAAKGTDADDVLAAVTRLVANRFG